MLEGLKICAIGLGILILIVSAVGLGYWVFLLCREAYWNYQYRRARDKDITPLYTIRTRKNRQKGRK